MPTSLRGGVGPPTKKKKVPPPAPISERNPRMQPRAPKPTPLDKQATIHAAVHKLLPHEVAQPPQPMSERNAQMQPRRKWEPGVTRKPTPAPTQGKLLDTRYKAALGSPVNAPIKVPGRKGRTPSRQYLADTMSSEEKQQYLQDLNAVMSTRQKGQGTHGIDLLAGPRSELRTAKAVGRVGAGLANALIDPVASAIDPYVQQLEQPTWDRKQQADGKPSALDWFTSHQQSLIQGVGAGAAAGGRQALDFSVGPNIVNAFQGKPYSKGWAAVEVAGWIPFGKGFEAVKVVRALGRAGQAVRAAGATGAEAQRVYDEAFNAALRMPGPTKQAVAAVRRMSALKVGERTEVYNWFDANAANSVTADLHKQQTDAIVWEAVKGLPPGERKASAARIYNDIRTHLDDSLPEQAIHPVRNYRLPAELDPHYTRLPPGGVKPLNRAETTRHIEQTLIAARKEKVRGVPRNPQRLAQIFQNAHRLAVEGARFRRWYQTSAKAILDHVHGDVEQADKLTQLFAIYSANMEVPTNGVLALRAWDEHLANLPITQGTSWNARRANQAMAGKEWAGMKTNSFYANNLKHIDGKRYRDLFGDREVTVDIWMMRMFGFKQDDPNASQYKWVRAQIRELARQMGWEPEEVQAAGWVTIKSESERISLEAAAYDYAHSISTHRGQVNIGPTAKAVLKEIQPEGRNLIHEIIGVPGAGGTDTAVYIPMTRKIGPGGDFVMNEVSQRMAEETAAAYGHVTGKPSVPYGRIFQAERRSQANAVDLRVPGGLTPELRKVLKAKVGSGTEIHLTADGATFVNRSGTDNEVWLSKIERDFRSLDPNLERQSIAVAYDGRTVGRDEYDNLLGRIEQRKPGARAALDQLAARARRARRIRGGSGDPGAEPPGGAAAGSAEKLAADQARLAEINQIYDEIVGKIAEGFEPGKTGKPITAARNARAKKMAKKGIKERTVKQEARALAEDQLIHLLRTSDHPEMKRLNTLLDEAQAIWDRLHGSNADIPFGPEQEVAAAAPPAEPPAPPKPPAPPGEPPEPAPEPTPPERRVPRENFRVINTADLPPRYAPPEGVESLDLVDPTPGARVYEASIGNEVIGHVRRDGNVWVPTPAGRFKAGAEHWTGGEKTLKAAQHRLLAHAYSVGPTREDIPDMLRIARYARPAQERAYTAERGKRISAASEAYDKAGGGVAGHHAAKHAHKGEYPRIDYKHFQHFTREAMDDMVREIYDAEQAGTLKHFEALRAADAVEVAWEKRRLPVPSDIILLEKVFGRAQVDRIAAATEPPHWAYRGAVNVLGIPRAIQTSYDLSYLFRQGLVAGTRHPGLAAKVFAETLPKARTKEGMDAAERALAESPNAAQYEKYKLAVTGLGEDITRREEQFVSTLAEKIPGVGLSAREYTLFLATYRARLFDLLAPQVERAALEGKGLTVLKRGQERDVDKALTDLAGFINAATGRGNLGAKMLEDAAPLLNQLLFSPRLLASRLAFLNPVWYARLDPAVRKEALSSAMTTLTTGLAVLGLAHEAGAKVGLNPLSSDFGKIQFGHTRIDIWGGFQPIVRYMWQIARGRYISASTGEEIPLGSGIAQTARSDVALRFIRSKMAPLPGLIWDLGAGKNIVGDDTTMKGIATSEFLPLLWQDMYDYLADQGVKYNQPGSYRKAADPRVAATAAGIFGLGTLGVGTLTFSPTQPNRRFISPPSGGLGSNLGGSLGGSIGSLP